MYDAMAIARYLICACNARNLSITNLKLQKLLYFVWVYYYKATGKFLFYDKFYAWPLGPVIPEIYFEYCPFSGMSIVDETSEQGCNELINESDRDILEGFIKVYASSSAYELVNRTHRTGTPWSRVFANGKGDRDEIPFKLIIDVECVESSR